jgi:serine/threonine protein phosphatase PrpC
MCGVGILTLPHCLPRCLPHPASLPQALGDKLFQPFVSAAPQMKEFDLQQDDPFVVMGCDGVWDIFSDQEAVDLLIDIKVL